MKGFRWTRAAAVVCALGVAWARGGEPSFSLGVSAPSSVVGEAGSLSAYEASVTLTTEGLDEGPRGAQAWSLSVASAPGRIAAATTAGTIVDLLFEGGFQHTELGGAEGVEGAVSAVVLSFDKPVTLPPSGTVEVLKVVAEVRVPDPVAVGGEPECEPVLNRVFFVDGLRGSGQPVDNKVTYFGLSYRPSLSEAVTSVCPAIRRAVNLEVAVLSPEAVSEGALGEAERFRIPVRPGTAEEAVAAGIVMRSDLPGLPEPDPSFPKNLGGVQGWSISVATEPCFGLAGATVEGTAAAQEPVGYAMAGFEKTEVVNPAKNGGQEGAVSAVVLSFMYGNTLPPKGAEVVLKLSGSMDCSRIDRAGDAGQPCLVRIVRPLETGLAGSGQPVQTGVTVFGRTLRPGVRDGLLRVFGVEEGLFVRGNANGDGKVDIADPVWIVNELYRQGPPSACADAADANDDGFVDSSDAVYLMTWLFRSGSEPPAPFPRCGADPDGAADGLRCAETQEICRTP
ncbi:MAG: dockerin type I domain-containing protein [Planctomycetota bacterium]